MNSMGEQQLACLKGLGTTFCVPMKSCTLTSVVIVPVKNIKIICGDICIVICNLVFLNAPVESEKHMDDEV